MSVPPSARVEPEHPALIVTPRSPAGADLVDELAGFDHAPLVGWSFGLDELHRYTEGRGLALGIDVEVSERSEGGDS